MFSATPFEGVAASGLLVSTLSFEPPVFLAWVSRAAFAAGGSVGIMGSEAGFFSLELSFSEVFGFSGVVFCSGDAFFLTKGCAGGAGGRVDATGLASAVELPLISSMAC